MSDDADAKLSAMEGAGFYNQHSAMQAAGIARVLQAKNAYRTAFKERPGQ